MEAEDSTFDVRDPLERAIYDFFRFWAWFAVPFLFLAFLDGFRTDGEWSKLGYMIAFVIWLVAPILPLIEFPKALIDIARPVFLFPLLGIWMPTLINFFLRRRLVKGWAVALAVCAFVFAMAVMDGYRRPGGHFG